MSKYDAYCVLRQCLLQKLPTQVYVFVFFAFTNQPSLNKLNAHYLCGVCAFVYQKSERMLPSSALQLKSLCQFYSRQDPAGLLGLPSHDLLTDVNAVSLESRFLMFCYLVQTQCL